MSNSSFCSQANEAQNSTTGTTSTHGKTQFSQVSVTLDYLTMNKAKQFSRFDGISLEDTIVDLIEAGVEQLDKEENSGNQPDHLMTSSGYIEDNYSNYKVPQLTHHTNHYHNNHSRSNGAKNKSRYNSHRMYNSK